jgi:predicted RNase H-like HicB family nuclease
MDYQIFVEKQPNNGYVALALGWPDCVGTGETKEEAVSKPQAAVADQLAHGEIVQARIEATGTAVVDDPWVRMFGRDADDPNWDEFQAELRRIREEANRA